MPEPDEDSLRQELQALLAASPSHAELETTYAGRILAWLATPGTPQDTGSEDGPRPRKRRSRPRVRGA